MKKANKIATISVAMAVIITTIICIIYYGAFSKEVLYGANASISITDIPSDLTKDEAITKITEAFQKGNSNGYLVYCEITETGSNVTAYSFVGNNDKNNKFVTDNNNKAFFRNETTHILGTSEIGNHSLDGAYQTDADKNQINIVVTSLIASGMTSSVVVYNNVIIFEFLFVLGQNNLFILFMALIIGLYFALSYSIGKNTRKFSILTTNGYSHLNTFVMEVKPHFIISLITSFLAVVVTCISLLFYNGFYRGGDVIRNLVLFYFVLNLVILIYDIIIYNAVRIKKNYVNFEKGKEKQYFLLVSSIVSQILIIGILFVFGTTSSVNIERLSADIKNTEIYNSISDYNYLVLGREIMKREANDELGEFVRNEDRQGNVLLIERNMYNLGDISKEEVESRSKISNSMIVNANYLKYQKLLDTSGNQIEISNTADNIATVLIPPNYLPIKQATVEQAESFIYGLNRNEKDTNRPILVKEYAGGSISNFNSGRAYNNGPFENPSSVETSPIILVLANSSEVIDNHLYLSYLTDSTIVLKTPNLDEKINEAGLQKYVTSINNVNFTMQDILEKYRFSLYLTIIGVILSLIVLLFSLIISISVYYKQNRQIIFTKYVHGYSTYTINASLYLRTLVIPILVYSFCFGVKMVSFSVYSFLVGVLILVINFVITSIVISKLTNNVKVAVIKQK